MDITNIAEQMKKILLRVNIFPLTSAHLSSDSGEFEHQPQNPELELTRGDGEITDQMKFCIVIRDNRSPRNRNCLDVK